MFLLLLSCTNPLLPTCTILHASCLMSALLITLFSFSETCYLEIDRNTGIKAVSTPLDPRSPYFLSMLSVSQIENAVAHYEAQARDADVVSSPEPVDLSPTPTSGACLIWHEL